MTSDLLYNLPFCPGAWPSHRYSSLGQSSSAQNAAGKVNTFPTSNSPQKGRTHRTLRQTRLGRTLLNGNPSWDLSGGPASSNTGKRAYSASQPFGRRRRQCRQQVLKQTRIKQNPKSGVLKLSLDDVNGLCEVLSHLHISGSGTFRPSYSGLRTPIQKRNKAYRQLPPEWSSPYRRPAEPLTPSSTGSSTSSVFSHNSASPVTPDTPPLSPSPRHLGANRKSQKTRSGSPNYFNITRSPSLTRPSAESLPLPPPRFRLSKKSGSTNEAIPTNTTQGGDIFSSRVEPISEPEAEVIVASAVSRFTSRTKLRKNADTLDHYIAMCLIEGVNPERKTKSKQGFVYVASRPTSAGFVKIGLTADLNDRLRTISPRGAYGDVKFHDDSHQRSLRHFKFVEKVAHVELQNIRYDSDYTPRFPRPPGVKESGKTEWFRTNPEYANEVVNKWRDWAECDPFNKNGKLTSFWLERIEKRQRYDGALHGDIHARWSALLKQPTKSEIRWFRLTQAMRILGTILSWFIWGIKILSNLRGGVFIAGGISLWLLIGFWRIY
ncbi:hypothetical protein FQN54_003497 [Arachnomyces sp. PD_36]|nr:hypothetical protein FQN54_003497 [Arachnomyces sp. PD_36]